jgi:dTDP-4-amino-4,6-dideoxygalactose transaminase
VEKGRGAKIGDLLVIIGGTAVIPLNDLRLLDTLLADEIAGATHRVLASDWFILGPEVEAFENAFAAYHGMP